MEGWKRLITGNEDWLVKHVFNNIEKNNCIKYIFSFEETIRTSVRSLSTTLLMILERADQLTELETGGDLQDLLVASGIKVAEIHYNQDIELGIFLGFLKYYRQSYKDLFDISDIKRVDRDCIKALLDTSFDRIEIESCVEWSRLSENKKFYESEEQYRKLVELSIDAIYLHCQGKLIFSNKVGAKILGFKSPEELVGKSIKEFLHPDHYETGKKRLKRLIIEQKELPLLEQKLITCDRRIIDVEVAASPVIYQGKPAVHAVVRDISRRKKVEKELLESEKKYRLVFENVPIGIAHYCKDGKITACNEYYAKIFASSKEKLIGINKLSLPDQRVVNSIRKVLSGQNEYFEGYYHSVLSDKVLYLKAHGAPIMAADNTVTGGVIIIEDITFQKKAEEDLRRTQDILREKEKLVIIGQMAAGMAHEIRNPLTAVKGFTQLLAAKNKGDRTLSSYVDIILAEIDRANEVISDFLQLARPKEPVLKKQSVPTLIKETLAIIAPQALMNNIETKYEGSKEIPDCMLDKSQIMQVLINLGKNSIEAMPDGGIFTIRTGYVSENREIFIEIIDTGCGIAKEKLKNIGVPFYTTKDEGTGLGLSICYSIINAHKGRITVESKEGEGTKFCIFLPC